VAIDREKILGLAQKYVEKKRYDRAIAEYQKVIQEDPNDARTLLKVGDLQLKMEDYSGAIATYERVGKFYASQGFSLKAIAVYKQIREIISNRAPKLEEKYAHVTPKLAELYQQLGLTSDALAALDDVATRLQRQGREQEAIEVFRKVVELDPSNPLPHLRLAEALLRSKDVDGAAAEFAVAAAQLTSLGRRDDALKVFERLLQHKPDPAQARAAAELYLSRNATNDGLQALAKLQVSFQANPRDLDTLGLLARAFNHIGQAAKAIEVQKEMARIARDTNKVPLFYELIERLQKLVPNDEVVRQLAAAPPSDVPPAPPSNVPAPPINGLTASAERDNELAAPSRGERSATQTEDESSYEDVMDADIDMEEPIELSRRASAEGDVVVETSVQEVGRPSDLAPEARAQLAQILADAASLRRARLPKKAVATLRAGLQFFSQSIELREALCNVLLESGHAQEGAAEMLSLVELQIERLNLDEAVRTLQDILALEPTNERATAMLRELGYELVEETDTTQGHVEYPAISSLDEPLPAYDIGHMGAADVARRARIEDKVRSAQPGPSDARHDGVAQAERPAQSGQRLTDEIDDPFSEAPLPAFPLEAPTATGSAPVASSPPRSGGELESALEEAEFFASRGLYEDARSILDEQLARLPNHPLLLERLAELDAQEGRVQGASGTRPSPSASGYEDRAFDIAESLGAIDTGDRTSNVGSRGLGDATEQVDVEEVFAKFKEGVAKQIGVDDAQSHYDLGVAYKDMELHDDAIREFQTAARDPRRACVCHSMIGMIQLERGNINEAIEAMLRGLQVPERTKEQDAALSYELGAAYEVRKMNKQALDYFQRAARVIPGFRDVVDRVRRLQKAEPKQPARAVAVGADDEFDRAFEGMIGEKH
jgi:tetratricopeptide (TPR) repeat protein